MATLYFITMTVVTLVKPTLANYGGTLTESELDGMNKQITITDLNTGVHIFQVQNLMYMNGLKK